MALSLNNKKALGATLGGAALGATFAEEDKIQGAAATAAVGLGLGLTVGHLTKASKDYLGGIGFKSLSEDSRKLFTEASRKTSGKELNASTSLSAAAEAARNAKAIGKAKEDYSQTFEHNKNLFDKATGTQKATMAAAYSMKASADAINHHLIGPMVSGIDKVRNGDYSNIRASEITATAFNAFGVYELGDIAHNTANGDYKEAMAGLTRLSMGKMAYSSGSTLFAARSYMKENGITGGDFVASTITGQNLFKK